MNFYVIFVAVIFALLQVLIVDLSIWWAIPFFIVGLVICIAPFGFRICYDLYTGKDDIDDIMAERRNRYFF